MVLCKRIWADFKEWFWDNVNWCEGYYYEARDGTMLQAKPENKRYSWFYKRWLWPWKQNDCLCCNTVRGLIYGAVVGSLLGPYILLGASVFIGILIAVLFAWSRFNG